MIGNEAGDLRPCPFCGNDGKGSSEEALHVSHSELSWRPSYDSYSVQCDRCTATMGYSDSEEEAIAVWNTRASTSDMLVEAQALVKRLRSPGSGALWGPPITDVAADMIEALAAIPASADVLVEAAKAVLEHRVGEQPARGYLRDNDASRTALTKLAEALSTTPTPASDGVKLNGFRCHNCKSVAWTALDHAPARCGFCRCRDFSEVYSSAEDPVLPINMKEWLGGDEKPDDWGAPYLLRSGKMFAPGHNSAGPNWTASDADIIAYTPTPTPDRFGEGYRAGEWQDIASAPKDGTLFDIWVPGEASGWRMTNLWFSENGKLYKQGCSHPADIPRWPTHWRPLPAPPSIRALQSATGDEG